MDLARDTVSLTYSLLTALYYPLLTTFYLLTKAKLGARWDPQSKRWYTFRPIERVRRHFPQWRPYL